MNREQRLKEAIILLENSDKFIITIYQNNKTLIHQEGHSSRSQVFDALKNLIADEKEYLENLILTKKADLN